MLMLTLSIFRIILIAIMITAVLGIVLLGTVFVMEEYQIYRDSRQPTTINGRVKRMLRDLEKRVQKDVDAKARLRKIKEETATGGFFEESFVEGFDQTGKLLYAGEHRAPTAEYAEVRKEMDDRAADIIFKTLEEEL